MIHLFYLYTDIVDISWPSPAKDVKAAESDNAVPLVSVTSIITITICSNFNFTPTISSYLIFGNPTFAGNSSVASITSIHVPIVGSQSSSGESPLTGSAANVLPAQPTFTALPCQHTDGSCSAACESLASTGTWGSTIYSCNIPLSNAAAITAIMTTKAPSR